MVGFFWYPLIALLVTLSVFINKNFFYGNSLGSIINNLSLIFHYSFLSSFIIRVLPQKNKPRFIKVIFLFFLFLIIMTLLLSDMNTQVHVAFSISNLGLTIFCIIYYYQLFNNIPIIDLRKEPSFWIVTGVFFCMSMFIPISATRDYLKLKIGDAAQNFLYSILVFCYIVMHLFFVKAYLCAARQPKL